MHETLAIIVANRVSNCALRAVGDPWTPEGDWRVVGVGVGPGDLFDPVTGTFSKPVVAYDPAPGIAAAWAAADAMAEAAIDHNSREQFIVWLIDPSSSLARKHAIGACLTWMGQIWATYAATKAQIVAGEDVVFEFSTPCPYAFWEVASS